MPDHYRALVSWGKSTDIPRDRCSNTLYFQNDQSPPTPDYDDLASDIADVYAATGLFAGNVIDVRMYNMEDAEPRPIRGQKVLTVGGTAPALGPREVALCLSYYGERNLPTQRGRVFLGPYNSTAMGLRPSDTAMNALITMGQGLAGIGGENISWRVHSVKTGDYHHIRNIWVNDEWDTMRSRGLRQTKRFTAEV